MHHLIRLRRLPIALALALVLALGLTSVALAHVKVNPAKAIAGAYQEYTFRVPNEGKTATTKIEVQFPAGLTFSSVQPKAGWTYSVVKDASQKVTGIVWTGGQIQPGEYDTFSIMAKNPKDPGTLIFPSIQTYADGTVVQWTGAAGSEKPAPTVELTAADAAAASTDHAAAGGKAAAPASADHDHTASGAAPTAQAAPAPAAPAPASSSNLPTIMGGGALLISLVALGLSLFKK